MSSSIVDCTFAARTPTPVSQKRTFVPGGPTHASSIWRSPDMLMTLMVLDPPAASIKASQGKGEKEKKPSENNSQSD